MYLRAATIAIATSVAGISVASTSASAQTDPSLQASRGAMQEVVVTGRRDKATIQDLDEAQEVIDRTAGGANLVDAESYRNGRVSNLQDMLGLSAGILVQPRFGSDEARLSIRGSGLQRTFHLRGINLLQDGVPITLADGSGDFQALDGLSSRYVEVYRGANALAYGSTTLGGAINLVSPAAGNTPPLQFRGEAGSFGYQRAQAAGAWASESRDYDGFLSVSHTAADGFRDHAKQNNQRLSSHVGWAITERLSSRFFVYLTDTDSDLPGNLTKAQLNANPEQANPGNVSGDQQRDFKLWRVSNKTTYDFSAGRIEALAYYSAKDLFHPIFQVLDQDTKDYGAGLRFVTEQPLGGRRNIATLGTNYRAGDTDDDRFVNVGGQRGARTAERETSAVNYEFYLENQHYLTERVALVVGGQFTSAERTMDDRLNRGTPSDMSFSKTYRHFSPKLGARYVLSDTIQFFANVSGSFEPPSFGELTGGQVVSVVDDQKAVTFEIGSRGSYAPWAMEWDVALYRAALDDELLSLTDATGQPLGTVSADKTVHQGLELGLINQFGPVSLRQSYLWNDFSFDSDAVYGNNELAGVPEHYYRAELQWAFAGSYYAGPIVEWVPTGYAVDHANTLFTASYATLGFKAGYRADTGFSAFIEGRNLTDKTYAASTGVIADAGGVDSAQFLPGDGASVYLGLEWRR